MLNFDQPDELAQYLEALERDERCRVEAVLKTSPAEVTELVYLTDEDGTEQGPFIRKRIDRADGLGETYRTLHQAYLEHKHFRYLPEVYDCHDAGATLVVLMEYVQGISLRELVTRTDADRRMDLTERIFPHLCEAVRELHETFPHVIIHRDLTPSNIMCSTEDPSALKLIDFGISRTYKPEHDSDTTHYGTRPYAAPEQFGFGQTDMRTDVYALGMLLYFCLTGKDATPRGRDTNYSDEELNEQFKNVIVHAGAFAPEQRYENVRELEDAFTQAWQTYKAQARPVPAPDLMRSADGPRRDGASWADGPRQDGASWIGRFRGGQSPWENGSPWRGGPPRGSEPPWGGRPPLGSEPPWGGEPGGYKRPDPLSQLRLFFSGIPAWVGRLWNMVLIALYCILLLALCVVTFSKPYEQAPAAFNIYTGLVFLHVNVLVILWLLMDKRRLTRLAGIFGNYTFSQQILRAVMILLIDWLLWIFMAVILGTFGFLT